MDDQKLLKRYTDCIYFLASPLTCKKGAECEYRHCDAVRLNPRDCWYWLSGTCSNLSCPFRHLPLDVQNEVSTEFTGPVPNQPPMPITKSTVPCYYYYSGFCNKGDSCLFLHEPVDTFLWNPNLGSSVTDSRVPPSVTKRSVKTDAVPNETEEHHCLPEKALSSNNVTQGHHTQLATVPPSGNKTADRTDTVPKLAGKHPSLFEKALISSYASQGEQKQPAQKVFVENVEEDDTSVQTYVPKFKETVVAEPATLDFSEVSPKSEREPSLESDQSSEELIDGNSERDEWWESSPGFDVLVDGQTRDVAYEDDVEYMHPQMESDADSDPLFVQYGFETDSVERGIFSNDYYERSEHLDSELRANHGIFYLRHGQNRKMRHIDSRKRKFLSSELPIGGCNNVDLRDHLRRKRTIDCDLDSHDLRHELLQRRSGRQNQHSHVRTGRLASRVERDGVWLGNITSDTDTNIQGRFRNSRNNYRNSNGRRRRNCSGEGKPRSYVKRDRCASEVTLVTKPRSFIESEEDKRQVYIGKYASGDFKAPKPLSEILKEKKKTTVCEDGTMTG